MKNFLTIAFIIFSFSFLFAQDSDLRISAHNQNASTSQEGLTSHMPAKNIGPTIFSGRISDLEVNPKNSAEFYAAYASGGLWYTENNGTTFSPIFDNEAVMTIGDIAVDWENDIIWVGTGEVNSSRSSYAGIGVYKSTDKGKTWTHQGLTDTHHIGRIVIDKDDSNTVYVAALGHLYTTNEERGIYKTTDGGNTWKKTLFVDEMSGAVDLIADPLDSNTLYAATWERIRKAWNFQESGNGSGIYKSIDKGETWKKITSTPSGFPNNEGTGRIGIDAGIKDGKSVLYAILDNYNRRPAEPKKVQKGIRKGDFEFMTKAGFATLNSDDLQSYLDNNGFPNKYSASVVKTMVANDKLQPIALKEYVENANSLLFDTPVIGAEVYKSLDAGKTWTKTHDYYLDGLYNSYGYYFGQIRVDPTDADKLYIMGVPILRSDDGGKNWKNIGQENVHADHHALWINPNHPAHIVNGNDGGINISYDFGESWIKSNMPSVGQFYYINVDNAEPYNVYGGTQDNGVWVGSNNYRQSFRWHSSGEYPYKRIMGGDGMQVQIDSRDNNTVYTGFQFGNYFRINKATGDRTYITPKHELGDSPYRWNWQSPILLSPHNQDIFYMGSNKLLRSMNQGETFTAISEDLTTGGKQGDVAYGTLTSISESPLKFGLIYTGSDDGKVYRTDDGGADWEDLSASLPKDRWVSRIIASNHEVGRVYLAMNGYRNDDFKAYLYMSDDYGNTWNDISTSLPTEPVNVIKEDSQSEDLLFVGTDHGTYVSLDRGSSFAPLGVSIPKVPVHDLVIQDRDAELLIGTHGRSIYKVDIQHLRNYDKIVSKGIQLFSISETRYSTQWGNKSRPYNEAYIPTKTINLFSNEAGAAKMEIKADNDWVYKKEIQLKKGFQSLEYNLDVDPSRIKKVEKYSNKGKAKDDFRKLAKAENGAYYLLPGTYIISLKKNGKEAIQTIQINSAN